MLRLKEWFVLIVRPQMDPASLASGGPVSNTTLNGKAEKRITVSQMQLNMFCDMVIEVSPRAAFAVCPRGLKWSVFLGHRYLGERRYW
jgi:hypothetical protein